MMGLGARCLSLAAVVAGVVTLCRITPEIAAGGEAGVVMRLPSAVSGMVAEFREPGAVERALLPADTEFAKADYATPTREAARRDVIHCGIVLSGAERRSIHRPEVCLQGQGWTIAESRTRRIAIGPGRGLRVRDLEIRKNAMFRDGARKPVRARYVYWFVGRDVATPSHWERVWLTLRDNITRGVNHRWACVSVLAVVTEQLTPGESGQRARNDAETEAMLDDFIRGIVPRFQKSFMDNPPVAAAD